MEKENCDTVAAGDEDKHWPCHLILQTNDALKAQRVESYLHKTYPNVMGRVYVRQKKGMLFVHSVERSDALAVNTTVRGDELLHVPVHRISFVDVVTRDRAEVAALMRADGGAVYRVQATPYHLQHDFLYDWPEVDHAVPAHPKDFTHLLCIVFFNERYYCGVVPRAMRFHCHEDVSDVRAKAAAVSRAYYKMDEVAARGLVAVQRDWVALDVGAAPGGWTQWLAAHVREVVAVDPGDVVDSVAGLANVHYVRGRVQEEEAAIRAVAPQFDLITCDVNQDAHATVEFCLSLMHLLRPHGMLVMTIKMFRSHRVEKAVNRALYMEKLRRACSDPHIVWLFANTKNERTLVARKMTDEEAAAYAVAHPADAPIKRHPRAKESE